MHKQLSKQTSRLLKSK